MIPILRPQIILRQARFVPGLIMCCRVMSRGVGIGFVTGGLGGITVLRKVSVFILFENSK
jgi:hypothetical protein